MTRRYPAHAVGDVDDPADDCPVCGPVCHCGEPDEDEE